MKQYLVLFREPDGRKSPHNPEELRQHRQEWQQWQEKLIAEKRLAGGKPLTLTGNVINGPRQTTANIPQPNAQAQQVTPSQQITEGPYTVGTEIVGGYLLINADNLEEATALMQTCPIFDFDGFAELREVMDIDNSPTTGQ